MQGEGRGQVGQLGQLGQLCRHEWGVLAGHWVGTKFYGLQHIAEGQDTLTMRLQLGSLNNQNGKELSTVACLAPTNKKGREVERIIP